MKNLILFILIGFALTSVKAIPPLPIKIGFDNGLFPIELVNKINALPKNFRDTTFFLGEADTIYQTKTDLGFFYGLKSNRPLQVKTVYKVTLRNNVIGVSKSKPETVVIGDWKYVGPDKLKFSIAAIMSCVFALLTVYIMKTSVYSNELSNYRVTNRRKFWKKIIYTILLVVLSSFLIFIVSRSLIITFTPVIWGVVIILLPVKVWLNRFHRMEYVKMHYYY